MNNIHSTTGEMDDNSVMTFGIHLGKALVNVPADYLLWLISDNFKGNLDESLRDYIEDNLDILNDEVEDTKIGVRVINKSERSYLPSTNKITYILEQ